MVSTIKKLQAPHGLMDFDSRSYKSDSLDS